MLTSGTQIGGGIGVNFANLWPLSLSFFVLFLYGFTNKQTIFIDRHNSRHNGAIPLFATEKEPKRNFLYFTDVTLVVEDIKSERVIKMTCLQQDLFDMTMVTIMLDTKTSKSESFIDRSLAGIINIMMEFIITYS